MIFRVFKTLEEKIKDDQEQLILKLASADISTLIIEMANRDPISNNIVKRQNRGSFTSEDSISAIAHRIAFELSDSTLKARLLELLEAKEFLGYRKYVFRCLTSLCVNTRDYELFTFLIGQLEQSSDEELISSVLSRLERLRKPKTLNIDYIKNLLLNGTYQNRISALSALSNCEHPEVEALLIHFLKTGNLQTKCITCATLRSTGTKTSIEILNSEHKRTRSNDLKYLIESAIKEINERNNSSS